MRYLLCVFSGQNKSIISYLNGYVHLKIFPSGNNYGLQNSTTDINPQPLSFLNLIFYFILEYGWFTMLC